MGRRGGERRGELVSEMILCSEKHVILPFGYGGVAPTDIWGVGMGRGRVL